MKSPPPRSSPSTLQSGLDGSKSERSLMVRRGTDVGFTPASIRAAVFSAACSWSDFSLSAIVDSGCRSADTEQPRAPVGLSVVIVALGAVARTNDVDVLRVALAQHLAHSRSPTVNGVAVERISLGILAQEESLICIRQQPETVGIPTRCGV